MTVGTRPVWYRSLYWRIAFGFVALLAVVLVLQVILFLWLTDRIVGPSSKSPQQLATNLAAEIAPDLAADPSLALDPYLRDKFGHIYQPFLVVLQDSRFGSNRFDRPRRVLRARCCRGRVEAGGSGTRVAAANRGEGARADAAAEVSMAVADRRNQRHLTAGVRDQTVPGRPLDHNPDRGPIEARTRAWAIVRPIRMDAAGAEDGGSSRLRSWWMPRKSGR
jgi:hypothetical protein